MEQTYTKKEKVKQLSIILVPILVTQLGLFAMNFFDTIMSGQYSTEDLAGVAIGSSLWMPVFTGLSGILMSITPIVAQLVGAKKEKEVPQSVIQGIYVSIIMALIVVIAGYFALSPILNAMNIDAEVRRIAYQYLIALSFGILPLFIYNVLRSFIDALGLTRISMFITLMSLPLNIIFNYVLIFGKLGLPALGGVGAGVASAITYWLIAAISIFIIHRNRPFKLYQLFSRIYGVSFSKWKEILVIGIPIGFSIFFETSIFSAVTLFMSSYSTEVVAAHQAAINFSSFLYMIPLSIAMALTIVVGFEVGAGRMKDAKLYSWMGVGVAVTISAVLGLIVLFFREPVASIYVKDKQVIALTAQFLFFAVLFQLSDAVQASVQGVLRGYKDVNITLIMTMISYWVIGLPGGYLMANYTDLAYFGYWLGLIAGLTAGAVTLTVRLLILQKRRSSQVSKV
ncbi:MATE family efflux transporter [Jeotgalibacillus proteolyticus]|uniref:Probable multidrug resistance protein NorM n=1 Tax=Jeotgalibacillus proteolyticus TaxID=2082395 RepID=A0A2S5GE53_9BACL|nr:MATE family efflux transporter [Jeotgalibacillus proteolyticus]PPA71184.1 MATE family efflux transporter [Jeotgalibacillus proteolyticus]